MRSENEMPYSKYNTAFEMYCSCLHSAQMRIFIW